MEEWKDVEGYEGYYQVSNLGRVKNLSRKVKAKCNSIATKKERILKQLIDPRGYKGVTVAFSVDSKYKRFTVSRLVAKAFIPNPDNLPLVEHKDDDPTNNHFLNLKWGTHSTNALARFKDHPLQ